VTYEITVLRTAVKSVEKLPKEVQDRIVEAIAELAETPRPTGSKQLIAREALRIRVGDYRIIYEVDDESKTVQVVVVSHRKDAYRP
jgi:mRNA interferase RelE/StbE